MLAFRSIAAAALVLASASSAFADCVPSYNFTLAEDQVVTTTMQPRVGKTCRLRLGAIGLEVDGVKVVTAPTRGKLSTAGNTTIVYTAGKTAGSDRFVFQWVGRNRYGRPSFMGVDVAVTIVP